MAVEATFEPSPDQVRLARRFVVTHVPAPLADDAAIVASELVANAIEHAATPVTVIIDVGPGRTRVEVSDSSSILPAVRDLLSDGERGR